MSVFDSIDNEIVGECYVCGKPLARKDYKQWAYFHGIIVCREHPGVKQWYKACIRMSEEKLKRELGESYNYD
jgi:hypothetical protein